MSKRINNQQLPYYEYGYVDGVHYIAFTSTANRFYSREITPEICELLSHECLTDQSVVGINRYIMKKDKELDLSYPSTIRRRFLISEPLREYIESGIWKK